MKKIVLELTHKAEVMLSNSTATKNRPLSFQVGVITVCVLDILVMAICMIKLMK